MSVCVAALVAVVLIVLKACSKRVVPDMVQVEWSTEAEKAEGRSEAAAKHAEVRREKEVIWLFNSLIVVSICAPSLCLSVFSTSA